MFPPQGVVVKWANLSPQLREKLWEKIAEVLVDVDSDYVDFIGLDINTDFVYVLLVTFKNPTGLSTAYYAFVEEDYIVTNYYTEYVDADGTTIAAGRTNEPLCAGAPAGEQCSSFIYIFLDPDGYFRWTFFASIRPGASVFNRYGSGCKTAPVTNITRIRIQAERTGGIGAGSKLGLFRVRGR